jgi:hypothetical protein
MADVGFKASEEGIDVKRASDSDLIISSTFDTLKIFKEGEFSNVDAGERIAGHSLGYDPMFLSYGVNSDQSRMLPTLDEDGIYYKSPRISKLNLIQENTPGQVRLNGYYYIFKNKIDEEIIPEKVVGGTSTKGGDSGDIGIKVSKDGYDVKKASPENLIMSSSYQVKSRASRIHLIHMLETGKTTGSDITVTHDLGYIPEVWWYARVDSFGDSRWQMLSNATDTQITITDTITKLSLNYTGSYSCVVFKDKGA